jgi:Ran GTPase-activating protein 1
MSSDTVYSLEGKNLKLTSREDIEPYITEINAIEDLQEIHLGGNTLGVGACQALSEALKNKNNLRVSEIFNESLRKAKL